MSKRERKFLASLPNRDFLEALPAAGKEAHLRLQVYYLDRGYCAGDRQALLCWERACARIRRIVAAAGLGIFR